MMNNAETMKHARAAVGKSAADVAVDGAVERLGNALVGHTPGEWVACNCDAKSMVRIETKGTGNDLMPIASLFGPDRFANARLIAAAPELLAACRRFEAAVGFLVAGLPANHAVAKDLIGLREVARAAIARAEGGAA